MKPLGLGLSRNMDAKAWVQRYQWEKPDDMIHVDTKQMTRFELICQRITGDRRQGCSRDAGYEDVHVAVDDTAPLVYAKVLHKATLISFLSRPMGRFSEWEITCRRALSGNGSYYRAGEWPAAPWISIPSAQSVLHPERTARLSGSSRNC